MRKIVTFYFIIDVIDKKKCSSDSQNMKQNIYLNKDMFFYKKYFFFFNKGISSFF